MENKETLVNEQVAENTEQTAEESTRAAKTYTQEEVDAIVGKRIARSTAKIRKEYDREYGDLMETLRAGTGKEGVDEINDAFKQFYTKRGVQMPQKPQYSQKDLEVLARAEADEIICGGLEDVVEEVERLAEIGAGNMTAKEKAVFKVLAEHRQTAERGQELAKAGVTEDVYNSPEFKAFADKFKPKTPIGDVYNIYQKTQPKKEHKPMGSMKNTNSVDGQVKDYYSPEEAKRFLRKELDANPALFAAIEKSMQKWRK